MRTILFFITTFLTLLCFAQETQDYYVVAKANRPIEPVQKTTLTDGKLALTFSQPELQSFFSSVEVQVQPYALLSVSPNPAHMQVTVQYDIENAASAYLIVTELTQGVSNNYILDVNSTETTIDLTGYPAGHYAVTLVCDGYIIESKNLIKN